MKKLDEAKEWYTKLAEVEPTNKEAFYSLGVITWAKVVSGAHGRSGEAWNETRRSGSDQGR